MRLLPSLSTKLLRAPSFADMRAVDVRQRMQRRTIGVQPQAPYCAGRRNAGEQRQRSTPSPAVFFMFWPPYFPPQSPLIFKQLPQLSRRPLFCVPRCQSICRIMLDLKDFFSTSA